MTESFLSFQGVVLRVFPFRDYDQILSLFTSDFGVIKLISFGSRRQRSKWRGFCTPLNSLEVVCREKRGELYRCHDITLIDAFEDLKKNYLHLEAACDLLNAVYASQMAEKPSPALYQLMSAYFKKIALVPNPWVLAASFRLKLLRHDGWIEGPFVCVTCGEVLWHEASYFGEEFYCYQHSPPVAASFSAEELLLVYHLMSCRRLNDLVAVDWPDHFQTKVIHLFGSLLER